MKNLINYINESAAKVELTSDGMERGFEYVDLGLPSKTMWATCNVGAATPEDNGLLFQWGRVDGYYYGDRKHNFKRSEDNLSDTNNEEIPETTSCRTYKCGDILNYSDDAARVNITGKWRMPTKDEMEELINNTTHTVKTINRMKGMLFTSNINGHSIFMPFCGMYDHWDNTYCCKNIWTNLFTSNVDDDNETDACALYFDKGGNMKLYICGKAYAGPIRGVFKK